MKNLELIEKSLKKNSTQQLVSKLEKMDTSNSVYEVIVSLLEKRGQDVSKWKAEEPKSDVVYEDTEDMTEEDLKIVEQHEEKVEEPSLRDKLIEEVDRFMDELIAQKRTGVNLQVLKALGGMYGSDLDILLENATLEQLQDAISFKSLKPQKEVSKVDSLIAKGKEMKNNQPKKEQSILLTKSSKSIILEESEEVEGLKVNSNVEFKAAPSSKLSNQVLNGVVLSVYKCHKSNFKEYCKISFDGNIFYKRSNSLKLV